MTGHWAVSSYEGFLLGATGPFSEGGVSSPSHVRSEASLSVRAQLGAAAGGVFRRRQPEGAGLRDGPAAASA